MRILIVGAGSVGQLYGFILQRAGATVDVYVRPRYAEDAASGFLLYDRSKGLQSPDEFIPSAVRTTPEGLKDLDYDAVILCIPSTGLNESWLAEFTEPLGDTLLISLTPGLQDREMITRFLDDKQVATGMITSVSYPAPLPTDPECEPGTAYWFPPMAPATFEGDAERLQPILELLKKGGMKSKRVSNLAHQAAFGTAVLMPSIAVLETVDWSFTKLRKNKERRKFLKACQEETISLVEAYLEKSRPLPLRLLSPALMAGALVIAPSVPPFDLETYLKVHFTKVGAQTRQFLSNYIEQRAERGLSSPNIEALLGELT